MKFIFKIPKLPKNKTFLQHIDSDEYPYLDSGDKNTYRLFQLIMEMFNFKLSVRRATAWGVLSSNGTWKGIIGMLSREEVDFGIPAYRWANERYGLFEQTTQSFYVQYIFVFLHPKSIDVTRVYLSPFNNLVWCLIGLTSLGISYGLRRTFLVENQYEINEIRNDCSHSNSILMVFGYLFQQGKKSHRKFVVYPGVYRFFFQCLV